MPTRQYSRPLNQSIIPEQLERALEVALGWKGPVISVGSTTVAVTHPDLGPSHDPEIQAAIAAYVYDPFWKATPEARTLRGAVPALRQWATDADTAAAQLGTAVTNWVSSGTYTAGKDAVLKQTLQGLQTLTTRLGRLCDRLADVLAVQGLSEP